MNVIEQNINNFFFHILGIQNSFPEKHVRTNFLQNYYQILMHGSKEPKLLLEGPPDSGKTSWVAPFQGNKNLLSTDLHFFIHLTLLNFVERKCKSCYPLFLIVTRCYLICEEKLFDHLSNDIFNFIFVFTFIF